MPPRRIARFHVSLKLIMRNAQRRVLLLKVLENSTMKGFHDLPGGRITWEERGLPLPAILAREIREELGVRVRFRMRQTTPVAVSLHEYYSKRYRRVRYALWVFFEAQYLGGPVAISSEHTGYLWARINKKNLRKYFTGGALKGMQNYFDMN